MAIWPTIQRFIEEHGAAVLVTLAECRGSSPREPGARMIVRPDGGFTGTIGGGALEWRALADAQAMLARAEPYRRISQALGPDLGQCCGGHVTMTLERFDLADRAAVTALAGQENTGSLATIATVLHGRPVRRIASPGEVPDGGPAWLNLGNGAVFERFTSSTTPLFLFGAGHVGRSLALALAPLPFAVTWIDPRPDAFPPHIPSNVTCASDAAPVSVLDRAPDGAFIIAMTHSHALDLDLVAAALRTRRFAYVGLIGSDTKRARFAGAMRKLGLPQDDIDRLTCPIGLPGIDDKAPAAIAASIAAQLLLMREAVARTKSLQTPAKVSAVQHG